VTQSPLVRLLSASVEVAQRQLVAARTLDTDGLRQATATRQDLLFELGVLAPVAADVKGDAEVGALLRELRGLDTRLERVLSTVTGVVSEVLGNRPLAVYASDGRLRRGA